MTPPKSTTIRTDVGVDTRILDRLPDPFLLFGLDDDDRVWRVIYANAASATVTGWPIEEIVGGDALNLVGPLTDPAFPRAAHHELSRGHLFRRRLVLHCRDGTPLWCDLRGGALMVGAAPVAWAQIVVEETTGAGGYRRLLENVSDTVAVLDGDGTIRYVSPSVQYLGSIQPADYVNTNFLALLDPDFATANDGLWREIQQNPGLHGPIKLTLYGRDGQEAPVEVVLNNRLDDPEVHGIVITARSIVDRMAADEVAAQMERRLRALVQHASDIVLVLDDTGRVTYSSPSVERILGLQSDPAGANGRFFELLHPDDVSLVLQEIAARLDVAGDTGLIEARLRALDGEWTWFELAVTNLLEDGDVAGFVVNGRDVSERRRTEALLAGELSVLETMASSHTLAPVLRRLAEVAESFIPGAACSIGVMGDDGVIRQPAGGSLPQAILAGLDVEPVDGPLGRQLRELSHLLSYPDVVDHPDWVELGEVVGAAGFRACWWVPVHGASADEVLGVVTVFHPSVRDPHGTEVAVLDRLSHLAALALERGRFERRLEHQAVHDGLTGIPNRTLLLDRVEHALQTASSRGSHTAVLFIDLDRFKVVNDSLGHAAGDALLQQVASRLMAEVKPGDTVGRFGGDEFVVVVEEVAGEAGAIEAGERMLAALGHELIVAGQPVRISASIGIALAGPDTEDVSADAMIRNADAAMYRAKDAGRSRVWLFEETLHAEAVRRYELEQGLRSALANGELAVHYQPRVRLADGRVVGVEALLRWDRPGMGRISAGEMIGVAEETGLIVPIGAWVLEEACVQTIAWDSSPATAGLEVSVNLSARQLGDPALVEVVARTLATSGLAAQRLCLEVTESALAADPAAAADALLRLKRLGVRLAIDDFGTGYATLDYVRRFSMADELKIDRSFVSGIADLHSPDAAIVSAAIVLADALGFEVVAEGVETAEQLAVLRRLGCGQAQGYYFGRAVPPDQIG